MGVCSFLWERGFLLVLVCYRGGCGWYFRGIFWGGGGGRLMEWEGLDFGYV